MLDAQIAIQEHALAITTATGIPPGPTGARHPTITPFSTFRASDGFLVIAAGNDELFAKLCAALGIPDTASDPRFATNAERCKNVHILKRLIEAVTLTDTASRWIGSLEAAGVPTGRVQTMAEALADPQIRARHMLLELEKPPARPAFAAAGNPVKMSGLADPPARLAAPVLDGDRQAILDWLETDGGAGKPD
jgi:CoA:oxalate CoA-transferase